MAEMKVVAFMYFARVEFFHQDAARKCFRRCHGEIASEGKDQQCVQAALFQQALFRLLRRDHLRRNFRPEDANWMRIECDGNGLAARFPCPADHLSEHMLMATMYS